VEAMGQNDCGYFDLMVEFELNLKILKPHD
jgi:hypothetical protein